MWVTGALELGLLIAAAVLTGVSALTAVASVTLLLWPSARRDRGTVPFLIMLAVVALALAVMVGRSALARWSSLGEHALGPRSASSPVALVHVSRPGNEVWWGRR